MVVIAVILIFALGGSGSKHGTAPQTNAVAHVSSSAAPPAATASTTTQTPVAAPAVTSQGNTTTATGGTATGTTSTPDPTAQVASVEGILSLAATGRQALANGDIKATIANRRSVLAQLNAFQPDAQLAPSVAALKAAETFSLHADTTCGLSCPASVDQQSTNLKTAFLATFNPIASQYAGRTYTPGQI